MRPALLSFVDSELIDKVTYFVDLTMVTSKPHHLTTRPKKGGKGVSFNSLIPLKCSAVYWDHTVPTPDRYQAVTKEEFIDSLPDLLHNLYSRTALVELINQLGERLGGSERYILTTFGGWFITTPRLMIMINEEP